MTGFDEAAALKQEGPGRWSADVPPDWTQGRTAFGGLVAAYAVSVAEQVAGPDRPVRSVDVAFVAPLPPGPIQVDAEVLSQGRAATQLSVSLRTADGVLGGRVHVVCGLPRTSSIEVVAAPPSSLAGGVPDESGVAFPFIPGVTPTFTQHIAMRWCGEAFPFTGSGPDGAVIRSWIRHRTPATGLPAVVALIDACPPTVLPMAAGPAPVSTVRWSAQLVDPQLAATATAGRGTSGSSDPDGTAGPWFWYEGETVHAHDGYVIEQSRLYLGGQLVAWSEQLVTVYDRPAE